MKSAQNETVEFAVTFFWGLTSSITSPIRHWRNRYGAQTARESVSKGGLAQVESDQFNLHGDPSDILPTVITMARLLGPGTISLSSSPQLRRGRGWRAVSVNAFELRDRLASPGSPMLSTGSFQNGGRGQLTSREQGL